MDHPDLVCGSWMTMLLKCVTMCVVLDDQLAKCMGAVDDNPDHV